MNRKQLKQDAKAQLGSLFANNWINGLLVCFLSGLLISAASVVPVLGSVIVFGPITYAVSKIFLQHARTNSGMAISGLFDGFQDDFAGTFLIGLMISIFTCLWSLLFIIPGIVKSYAYSMAYYIKVDHPEYDWQKCIEESKALTKGHKGELFVLDLSFIGWFIVGSLCLGIGLLWVTPYQTMAKTKFYEALTAGSAAE